LGLRGQFSNLSDPLSVLLSHSLTALDEGQDPREVTTAAGWPDGRREFGSVGAAVPSMLAQARTEMKAKAIHAAVERLVDGVVARYSVSDYLRRRSADPRPLFVRTRHYRLLR
jgi:hypothetical protein